jgi:hypothetical protein
MKNAVFWDVVPCRSCVNRRFGGTYRLHLQGRKIKLPVDLYLGSEEFKECMPCLTVRDNNIYVWKGLE